MSQEIDEQLTELMRDQDRQDSTISADAQNYYREVWDSFHGENSRLHIATWIGILTWGGLLIFCIVQMFRVDTLRELLIYAAFAIMLNSAQIALKLWYNMRLNRMAILAELRKLRLDSVLP